jgi:hypothetical protein
MDRREALRYLGTAVLAPLASPLTPVERWELGRGLHRRVAAGVQAGNVLSAAQLAEVRALAETIIPRTDTPGAADVGAPEFLDLLLAEWYPDTERTQLLAGLDALTARCREAQGRVLAELEPAGRTAFVATIDGRRGEAGSAEAAYARIKEVMVFAFLTSAEIGPRIATMPVIPGRFDGCIPVGRSAP